MAALFASSCSDAALENRPVAPPKDTTEADSRDADVTDVPDIACTSDETCRDLLTGLSACDVAFCNANSGLCEVARREGCCLTVSDCPASTDPCIDNQCPLAGGSCVPVDNCASCTTNAECDDRAPACTLGRCSEGLCIFSALPTCCIDAADCDDADVCTNATCDSGQCIHRDTAPSPGDGCCRTPPVIATSFSPAADFSTKSNVTDAGWYVRTTNFTPSPPAALYLGSLTSFVNTSAEGAHSAEARFELGATRSGAIEIKFQVYLDLRETPEVDRFRVTLVSASGAERLVYSKAVATLSAWHPVKRSILVEDGGPWALVFTYDAVTVDPERRVGIMVDDLQVRTACGGEQCNVDGDCRSDDPCLSGACVGGECRFTTNPVCSQCQTDAQCDDNNLCTNDRCLGGRCEAFPVPNCCNADRDCNDNDACTIDRCRPGAGFCLYERDPNCGTCNPPSCDDGDPCTRDVCTANGCTHQRDPAIPGCACQLDRECNDGDECTTDRCVNGACQHAPTLNPGDGRPLCDCQSSQQCNDNNPCTRDACVMGICEFTPDSTLPGCSTQCQSSTQCPPSEPCRESYCDPQIGRCMMRPIPDCCSSVSQCNDNRICTEDSCAADGRCIHQNRPGCCESDAQCNDNNACTADRCNTQTGQCTFTPTPNCCTTNAQCNDNNACTNDACVNGQCTFTPTPNCCTTNAQCNDNNTCTNDACVNGQCTFTPTPNCCTTNAQCNDNNACTNDACVNGACTRTPIPNCCTANTQCNDGNACTNDACVNGQCVFTPNPNCCTTNAQCNDGNACTADACVGGQCVSTPIAGCCSSDAQCNDNNACTADRCDAATNQCVRTPITGCCATASQCNDNDPCTNDACVNNQCSFTPNNAPGCNPTGCTSDAQCQDGALCTANQCINGQCRTLPILGCCTSAADCNDNNACTNDFCVPGAGLCFNNPRTCNDNNPCTLDRCDPVQGCVFDPNPQCVCTEAVLWRRSFQSEAVDITIDGSGFGIQWRVDSLLAASPTQALRYGKEDGSNYANGQRTFGRATGPAIDIPASAGAVRLEFMVYVDIDRTPDSFRARALWGNQNVILWDHVELEQALYRQWVPVSVDLPAAAIGQDVRIRFVFDSLDGSGNQGQGVAVDDIVLRTICP